MDTAKFLSNLVLSQLDKQLEISEKYENVEIQNPAWDVYTIEIVGKLYTYDILTSKANGPSLVTVKLTVNTEYNTDDTGARFVALQYDISSCLVDRLPDFFNSLPGINTMMPIEKHLDTYNVSYCKQLSKDGSSPETWLTPTYNMKIKAFGEQHAIVIAQASYIEHNMEKIVSDNLDIFKWSWKAEKVF